MVENKSKLIDQSKLVKWAKPLAIIHHYSNYYTNQRQLQKLTFELQTQVICWLLKNNTVNQRAKYTFRVSDSKCELSYRVYSVVLEVFTEIHSLHPINLIKVYQALIQFNQRANVQIQSQNLFCKLKLCNQAPPSKSRRKRQIIWNSDAAASLWSLCLNPNDWLYVLLNKSERVRTAENNQTSERERKKAGRHLPAKFGPQSRAHWPRKPKTHPTPYSFAFTNIHKVQ